MRSAVIVDVVRTASGNGKPGGALSGVHPVSLLADLRALLERTGIDPTGNAQRGRQCSASSTKDEYVR